MRNGWEVLRVILYTITIAGSCCETRGQMRTWDAAHSIERIQVRMEYFVPADRTPLPDWRERLEYFAKRMQLFHQRESGGQSELQVRIGDQPVISERDTASLRVGDANAIFSRTLGEVGRQTEFRAAEDGTFRILLVLSEINWRPLDDFWRLRPSEAGVEFEGQVIGGQHFPGAASGGSRATYLSAQGIGWGLVSADGWRVPCRGSDCVIYHEGCGHTVGLPHPEPIDDSVMGLGQYRGWIHESFLNKEQKIRLGWDPTAEVPQRDTQQQLFDTLTVEPKPLQPLLGESALLDVRWDAEIPVTSVAAQVQTSVRGPWVSLSPQDEAAGGCRFLLPEVDRAVPVSWRVRATAADGSTGELWGYLQIRSERDVAPIPALSELEWSQQGALPQPSGQLVPGAGQVLIPGALPEQLWQAGEWDVADGVLVSPKQFGARLQIPVRFPQQYRVIALVEPLDQPNGLLLGLKSGDNRFATLFSFRGGDAVRSAVENIDGRNVGNETTYTGEVFAQAQVSVVIVDVTEGGVRMQVDGQLIADWRGSSQQLSLSEYWATPNPDALFIGAYDCRYRIHQLKLVPLVREQP